MINPVPANSDLEKGVYLERFTKSYYECDSYTMHDKPILNTALTLSADTVVLVFVALN